MYGNPTDHVAEKNQAWRESQQKFQWLFLSLFFHLVIHALSWTDVDTQLGNLENRISMFSAYEVSIHLKIDWKHMREFQIRIWIHFLTSTATPGDIRTWNAVGTYWETNNSGTGSDDQGIRSWSYQCRKAQYSCSNTRVTSTLPSTNCDWYTCLIKCPLWSLASYLIRFKYNMYYRYICIRIIGKQV